MSSSGSMHYVSTIQIVILHNKVNDCTGLIGVQKYLAQFFN